MLGNAQLHHKSPAASEHRRENSLATPVTRDVARLCCRAA
jgi:hypothetical protein